MPPINNRLPRSFYDRAPATVARELLGKPLLRRLHGKWLGGRIVETEAYLSSDDLASHSSRGKTRSNAAMFGPPGTLYVYPIHAKFCMNTVTESSGIGSAVLIRAIEPIWGIQTMQKNRGTEDPRRLTRGPAMLCQALDVDRRCDHTDLIDGSDLRILDDAIKLHRITSTPRIGITNASSLVLRFFVDGNRFVSGKVRDHQQRPARTSLYEQK